MTTLDEQTEQRLVAAETAVRSDPTRVRSLFPAAGRDIGRTRTAPGAAPGEVRLEDVVRVRLLATLGEALAEDPDTLAREVADLYRFGDAAERRAVLLGLATLVDAGRGERAALLVHDALRTNDVRLVAAALGPAGAALLDADAFRQAVLKCLFVGVPLDLVAGLDQRADAPLRTMVASYADERRAAGRAVPDDALTLLDPAGPDAPTQES
ncbi:EboA domain-containing protein [Nocardioides sp. 1609]|uniref:EboA domain-containing protein n=1 Tax=Nocardioides sp. 1609 TaxID=2508327 RepID=UPI0014306C6B|nr:EboA domain-containing protein [Nocardioides sp. 1609]